MELKVCSLSEIQEAAKSFLEYVSGAKSFAFYGEMGAGKTTFINALLSELGIEDHSSSPTFSIVNEYFSPNHGAIFHFDFYRVNDESEAMDIGIEDMIYDDNYCFIEWPERIENLLPENCVDIYIKTEADCRLIEIKL